MISNRGSEGGSTRSHFWGAILLELFAVFIGITAAFLLEGYRDERRDVERREQIVDVLAQELSEVSEARAELPEFQDFFRTFNEQRSSGERPALVAFFPTFSFRGDMWESALQMGGVELLDVELAMRLSGFYGDVQGLRLSSDRWNQFVREILIPNLGAGSDEFYDSQGSLRPKYEWYPDLLRDFLGRVSGIVDEADSLVVLLHPYGSTPTQGEVLDRADSTDDATSDSIP